VSRIAEDEQVLFLRQAVPTRHRDDVHKKRRYDTLLLRREMPKEPSRLQERSAEAEMDNILRKERTRLED